MLWKKGRRSDNVEDVRDQSTGSGGMRIGGGKGLSLVAVVTDVIRDGKPVIGYGFNSNGRYGQGALMRDRFLPRLMEARPETRKMLCMGSLNRLPDLFAFAAASSRALSRNTRLR